ncbi:MAG: TIGR03016 family PEP-CTERM system-associated outer membrane protein, partial [Burkholderiales bacterium PBB4]
MRAAAGPGAKVGGAAAAVWLAWPLSAVAAAAAADAAPTLRQIVIEPSASVTQTFSDNPDLRAVAPLADSVTRLTVGVGLRASIGRAHGFLDYSLSSLVHARSRERNTLQNQLNALVAADWLDNRLRLDASANIGRSAISAFNVQPDGSANIGSNTTEQRSVRLAPSWRGPLGAELRYSAGLVLQANDVKDSAIGDNTSASAVVHLEPVRVGRLSWSADLSHVTSHYKTGRTTDDDRVFASALARWDELDLRLNANVGIESTNLASANRQQFDTWGVGAEWVP